MLVRDVMTRRAETIGPAESLEIAARKMKELGVGALAVVEQDRVIGVLTDRDIVVRAVAAQRHPAATDVRSAMTPQVIACRDHDDLAAAVTQMQRAAVRRLVVLDAAERLTGLMSVDDVAVHSRALAGEILEHTRSPERPVQGGLWPWREDAAQ